MIFVLFRLSSIGDIINTFPVIDSLKLQFPDSKIIYVTKSQFCDILKYKPEVDEIICFSKKKDSLFQLAARILSRSPDYFIDLHNTYRSFIVKTLLQPFVQVLTVKRRSVIEELAVRLHLKKVRSLQKMSLRFLKTIKPLVPYTRWQILPRFKAKVWQQRQKKGTQYVAILPFSNWNTKDPYPEQWAEIINAIPPTVEVRIYGTKKDESRFKEMQPLLNRPVKNLIGRTSLSALITELEGATLFIGPDTGALHISMALGTKSIGIFGPTDPHQFFFNQHYLIYTNESCSPCHFYGEKRCHLRHHNCIRKIDTSEIVSIIRKELEVRAKS